MRLCPWSLALASSIPVLGLERFCPRKGCPWPWPRIFLCVFGLGLEPYVLDSTSGRYGLNSQNKKKDIQLKVAYRKFWDNFHRPHRNLAC